MEDGVMRGRMEEKTAEDALDKIETWSVGRHFRF